MKIFGQSPKQFFSSKSNWTGMTLVVTSITTFIAGTIDQTTMVQGVFGGLGLIFIKDAVAKQ